jgi:Predicted thioesterase
MSKQDFSHVFPLSVRWGDADVYGHINNVEFVRYIESGRVAYCGDVMDLNLKAGMESGWVLADIQCSYLQQVHYPALLEVRSRISKISNKSATILANIMLKGKKNLCQQAKGSWYGLIW